MKIQSVRGMNDIYEEDSRLIDFIETTAKEIFTRFGYTEIRTPIVENTALFKRSVGDTTDIVEKEMYVFEDRSGDSLCLRPEGTASVVRAYLEHSLMQNKPIQKFYYIGPMFRHERPQKGRYRQFYQLGVELIGVEEALADVEVISLQYNLLKSLGVEDVVLNISSLGCKACRPIYQQNLAKELDLRADKLCGDCIRRKDKNPLRVFDCKVEKCKAEAKDLPKMMDHICSACEDHFALTQKGLKALDINFVINKSLVRGLDYYNRTAFEFIYEGEALGAQATVSAGGRYDSLIETLGGKATPAVGFALGLERIALILADKKADLKQGVDVYCVIADEEGLELSLKVANSLRQKGLNVEVDLQLKKMKQQLKRASKLEAKYVLILGSSEIQNAKANLKNMLNGEQVEIKIEELVDGILNLEGL